jgi:LmbE family N-acetylglucosaminyl deacetylase
VNGLLVVTSHPDDEALIAGGTLAACAAAGIHTSVLCLTRGEEGPISDPAIATPETLGEVRVAELHAACARLGVASVRCESHPDSYLPWADDVSEIVREIAALIDELEPEAIITFAEDGWYWHTDHIGTLDFVRRALELVRTGPHALYQAALPPTWMEQMVCELRARALPADLWGIDPEDFGDEELVGAIELDTRPFVADKLRALRCHRSQIGPGHALHSIPADLAERFLGVEWFLTDAAADRWLERAVARGCEQVAAR